MLDTTRAALTRLPVSNTHIRILEGIISFKKQLLLLLSLSLLILLLLLLLLLYTFMSFLFLSMKVILEQCLFTTWFVIEFHFGGNYLLPFCLYLFAFQLALNSNQAHLKAFLLEFYA